MLQMSKLRPLDNLSRASGGRVNFSCSCYVLPSEDSRTREDTSRPLPPEILHPSCSRYGSLAVQLPLQSLTAAFKASSKSLLAGTIPPSNGPLYPLSKLMPLGVLQED